MLATVDNSMNMNISLFDINMTAEKLKKSTFQKRRKTSKHKNKFHKL